MSTNKYFSNYDSKYTEQRLVEDLIVESIRMMGMDCFYLPNTNDVARDLIYGEDPLKTFSASYPIDVYVLPDSRISNDGYFFSKFGLEIRDTVTIVISKRTFSEFVENGTTITRPREGDLIYVPVLGGSGRLYEIKFVNKNADQNMFGRAVPFFYQLEMELFKYSHEPINTGVPDIDIIQTLEAYTKSFGTSSYTKEFVSGEIVFQSSDKTYANSTATGECSTFDAKNNILYITNIKGSFALNANVYGQSSNATTILLSNDPFVEAQAHVHYDNQQINTFSTNNIVITTETNALGKIQ